MHELNGQSLNLEILARIAAGQEEVQLAASALERMKASRAVVQQMLHNGQIIYGVNTGFGRLSDVRIPQEDIQALQRNLILSHACGTGAPLSRPEVRAVLALKINALLNGYSGCRPLVAQYLQRLLQQDILPVIPEKGSVGASGDLAPLAHLALVLIGLGEAWVKDKKLSGKQALGILDVPPLELEAKEGLALLNGTQFMTGVGALALAQMLNLVRVADVCGAMSAEALLCTPIAFDARIQIARGHAGQQQVAANLRRLLANSPIRDSHLTRDRIQDAYCVRCMPQVHGAIRDFLMPLRDILGVELNAATDNPLVFAEDREILSGGNFHGHPIATACDLIALLATQLANISERRIAFAMDHNLSGLPAFLVKRSGLNSGFMIAQVVAAALVSENKVLSHPASADSIPTSANKEDYVSMGAAAAVKARNAVQNAVHVLGIELLCACQAQELRAPVAAGPATRRVRDLVREHVPFLSDDRMLAPDIEAVADLIRTGEIVTAAQAVVGEL